MAIVIQEEKRKINWFALGVVVLIMAIIFGAIYYLFFVQPSLIEKATSPQLQSVKDLSEIKLDTDAIFNNPNFQILKQYINPIEIGQAGKNNPFSR